MKDCPVKERKKQLMLQVGGVVVKKKAISAATRLSLSLSLLSGGSTKKVRKFAGGRISIFSASSLREPLYHNTKHFAIARPPNCLAAADG